MATNVHLGYEVGSGVPIEIPIRHMVVTGQTQEAGKTTTLEALILRANTPAIAFVTKRGEGSFTDAIEQPPYFRERADWQFVSSVLEAAMREKMKFERNWIIKASKGARTLADVHKNVKKLLETARGINEGVYTTLDAYLEIVVPRVQRVAWATSVQLRAGINVMNLSNREKFPPELQSLVMSSVLEWVYEHAEGTITIIPEAWEFIPQGRNSPVKESAKSLIRKGAGLGNYVWLDSQDIGGVDKEMLRQCPVWLIGVQREANEIDRVLSNIPAGIAKPSRADVATLSKGQFYACWGKHVVKVYVQPAWMDGDTAMRIARGESAGILPNPKNRPTKTESEDDVTSQREQELLTEIENLRQQLQQTSARAVIQPHAVSLPVGGIPTNANGHASVEEITAQVLARILKEPAIINLQRGKPELNVTVTRKTVTADESSAQGMVVILLSEGFFDNTTTATNAWKELKRRWNYGGISARCYEQLDKLTELGFVTKEADGYQAVKGMKVNIKQG